MVGSSELLQRLKVTVEFQDKTFLSPLIFFNWVWFLASFSFRISVAFSSTVSSGICELCCFLCLFSLFFHSTTFYSLHPSYCLFSYCFSMDPSHLWSAEMFPISRVDCLLPLMLFQYFFVGVAVRSERSDQPPCCGHLVFLLSEIIRGKGKDKIREQQDASMTVGQLGIMNERLAVKHCISAWSQKIAILRVWS